MLSPEEQGCQETPPAVVLGVVLERVFDDSNVDEAANLAVNNTKTFFRTTVPKSPINVQLNSSNKLCEFGVNFFNGLWTAFERADP